jgi:hypothetical protein
MPTYLHSMRLLPVLALLVSHATAHASDFQAAVEERIALYQPALRDPANLNDSLRGEAELSHRRIEAVVPKDERTAVDHFVLGNLFYVSDMQRSFRYHELAFQALPEEPSVALEMAYEFHRRGNCKRALPLYRFLNERVALQETQQALRAHCLMKTGDPSAALQAWAAGRHGSNHTGIDFAIHAVFGGLSPLARHDALARKVIAGDSASIASLIDNAIRWERDWWNGGTNDKALAAAFNLSVSEVGGGSQLGRELRVLESVLATSEPDDVRQLLEGEGLIVGEGGLPQSSYVARRLIERALQSGLVDVPGLNERFGVELNARARSASGDEHALVLAAAFAANSGNSKALRELDLMGWKRHSLPDFALSYLAGHSSELGPDFDHGDSQLRQTIDNFPEDPRFARTRVALAMQAGEVSPDLMTALIDAEYHGLRSERSRYSYALNSYFGELARMLSAPAAAR